MKRLLLNNKVESSATGLPSFRKSILPLMIILVLSGFMATAQVPEIPEISVRFTNPVFDCPTQNYCVDVEFLSDTPDQQLYGVNVRFFYDDAILEFLGMSSYNISYDVTSADVTSFPPGSGATFGFGGPLEWVNATVQLVSYDEPFYLSTNDAEWTRLLRVCFHVDDPNSLSLKEFCPSIVWDLQQNPPPPEQGTAGLQPGDDGVVISLVDPTYTQDSSPTTEKVVQFNWVYTGNYTGINVKAVCVTTICGYIIPVSNWALFLGIGLMLLTTIFIYRKRMS